MPLEEKRPRICPGYHPVGDPADALGDNAIGSPLDSAAAGGTTPELLPICRRATAAAAHITGAEAGESPPAEPEGDVGTDPSPMAGMLSREALDRRCRLAWVPERPLPPRAPDAGPLGIAVTLTGLSPAEEPATAADRIPRGPGPTDDEDGSVLDPDSGDPAEPVVSASAVGIEASAEPMPSATASTPTRPVKRPDDIEPATALLVLVRDWPSRLRDYPREDRLHTAKADVAHTDISHLRPARRGPVAQAVGLRTQKRAALDDLARHRELRLGRVVAAGLAAGADRWRDRGAIAGR